MRLQFLALSAIVASGVVACNVSIGRDGFGDRQDPDAKGDDTTADSGPNLGLEGTPDAAPPPPDGTQVDLENIEPCDTELSNDPTADAFLKAIGLCKSTTEASPEWGVIEAKFTSGFNDDRENTNSGQRAVLPKYGNVLVPREGERLGVLSTGLAQESPTRRDWGDSDGNIHDFIGIRIRLRVPINAKALMFDFNFHSHEWPTFVGSSYNDEFRVNLNGQNIAFGANNNPVNVNFGFFDRCTPGVRLRSGELSECPGGTAELAGTAFASETMNGQSRGGATGWLTTQASVEPGEIITLEFAIWDVEDGILDSLVLIDNFRWDADAVETGTYRPPN